MKHHSVPLAALLTLAVLLAGCDPQKRMQRKAERLVARAVMLDPSILRMQQYRDTVVVHDTLVVPGYRVEDTLVLTEHDTVYLDSGRLHVRVVRLPGEKVYVRGECDPDTVYKVLEVEVKGDCPPAVEVAPCPPRWVMPWWVIMIMAALFIALIWRIVQSNLKNNDRT